MVSDADTGKKRYRIVHADRWFRVLDTQTEMLLDVLFLTEGEALAFAEKLNENEPPSK
jgi:hypothetical protein